MIKRDSIYVDMESDINNQVNKIDNTGSSSETKAMEFSNEMKEAIKESDEIDKNPEKYKTYHNISDLMEDLESK